MAVNNTLSVKEYALTGGGTNTFPITFEFTTDDNSNAENIHCQLAEKNDAGEYDNSVELTEGVAGDFQIDGGNVKFIDDASVAGKFLVIYRSTPVTQLTDFIDNGNYSLEDIERALDKLTFIIQERTGTPSGTYINVGVSLFFASILQLTNKADFLNNIFTWTDIDDGDKPGIAGKIRSVVDLISKSGGTSLSRETIDGYKSFTNPPTIGGDPSNSTDAVRKSYADGLYSSAKSYTDNKFPISTSQISDGAVTGAKIASNSVPLGRLRIKTVDLGLLSYDIPQGDTHTFSYNVRTIANSGNPVLIKGYSITRQEIESGDGTWGSLTVALANDTISITAKNNNASHARMAYFRMSVTVIY